MLDTVFPLEGGCDCGQGQQIARCPTCHIALWSHYAGAGPLVAFVRVGTLDQPDVPAVFEYYDRAAYWPEESLARREALLPRINAWLAGKHP